MKKYVSRSVKQGIDPHHPYLHTSHVKIRMKNKLQKRAVQSLTSYKLIFLTMLISIHLKRAVHLWNMVPITFCAHRSLLISTAISPDCRMAVGTLHFGTWCRYRAPHICLFFPNSGVIGAGTKLIICNISPSSAPACPRGRTSHHSCMDWLLCLAFCLCRR